MKISVPYGKGSISAEIADSIKTFLVDPDCEKVGGNDADRLEQALDHPIGTKRLEDSVKPTDRVLIVINDHTRPGPNKEIVSALLARLKKAEVPDENISFIVATGSHRAPTKAELEGIAGAETVEKYKIIIHDCKNKDELFHAGQIMGLDIWLNKAILRCDYLITTGLISPHHTAGFSGGRKSILPGITGLDTLKVHHSLPLRPYEPSMGKIEGNTFHDVALAAAKKAGVDFMVNAVQDLKKQNVAFVAGDIELAHAKGVEICREHNSVAIPDLADVVVASPGGYPRDSDLYQAQKGLAVAEVLVKPGGTMILCCNGELGAGEGLFIQWMKEGKNPEEIVERYRKEGFNIGNNKAFMYARAMLRGKVVIVSDKLDPCELSEMGLDWAPDLQTAVDEAVKQYDDPSVIVLPRAVNIIPIIKQ